MNIPAVNQPYSEATSKTAAARSVARGKEAAPAVAVSAEPSAPSEERLTLDHAETLKRAMNACPETRSEVVARGKALASDPNYPPAAVVSKLSRLFIADAARSASEEA